MRIRPFEPGYFTGFNSETAEDVFHLALALRAAEDAARLRNAIGPKAVWAVLVIAFVAGWWSLLTLYGESLRAAVLNLLDWADRLGPWAPVLFILVVTLSILLLLPGMIFTLGGGFLFGVINGLLYVLAGTALGASNIPYRQFIIGTCIGIIPISLSNVYAGSLVGSLAALETGAVSQSFRST